MLYTTQPQPQFQALPAPRQDMARAEETAADAHGNDALAHRFRHAMRAGQVSPLFHLVMRHKQETGACHTSP